ncbi:MAG: tyrosine-type recombinase/integrase [Cyanobacteria bacterium SZAS LIN-2]|nr:tyrosine-type recombinase/integrase [Cyanobacteria bacterium SZAS LIN-2]MBS2009881.1 tyrosine-type recombinase/integrase [Cyanobacteria bacterium SZAS TMP-1]
MAEKINFKQENLKNLTCPTGTKQIRVSDTRVFGLQLRITPNGSKQYIYRRKLPLDNESGGKQVELSIGRFEDLSIEQARNQAEIFNSIVGSKKDPSAKAKAEPSYDKLFAQYIEDYAKLHTVTWEETVKNHGRYFTQWDKKTFAMIKREDVQSWVNHLGKTKGKHTANRQFNTFRAVLSWALNAGLASGENPCKGVKTFKTAARERFILPGEEYAKFAEALNTEEPVFRDFFWMCLFTGARCSNVLNMEWSQVNFDLQQWRIPITKNGDSQTIPLTLSAMEILNERKRDPQAHERWVFNSNRKGWKTGEKGHLASPRNAFQRIVEKAKLSDLRIHDLRRTAGSYMAIEGISPTIIGKALGHRSPQATAVYARLTQDPVRQALERAQQALTKPTNSDTKPDSQNGHAEQTAEVTPPQPAPAKRQKNHLRIVG